MKRTIKTLLVLTIGLATLSAWAEKPRHGDDCGPGSEGRGHNQDGKKHLERMTKELSLTKDQQDKAKALEEKREATMKAQKDSIRPLHEELGKLLEADKVDLTAVRQKLDAISRAQVEARMQHIQSRIDFEALLTPEQKAKMRDHHKKMMNEHRKDDKHDDKKHHDKRGDK